MIPALPDFLARYPDIQIEVSVGNRTANLIEQNIDCVIRIGELYNDSLIARSLGELPQVTCASRQYIERTGLPVHPADLALGHTLVQIVSPRTGQMVVNELYRDGQTERVSAQWQFAVNDSMGARTAALNGLGVVTTYRFLVEEYLSNGQMVELFLTGTTRRYRYISPGRKIVSCPLKCVFLLSGPEACLTQASDSGPGRQGSRSLARW